MTSSRSSTPRSSTSAGSVPRGPRSWPLDEVRQLLEPSLRHLGYSVYELSRAGRSLRLTIDKPAGVVSVDDCQRVSQLVGPLLDQADLIPDSYTLEVWSPGAERPLHDRAEYQRFVGFRVNVRARAGEDEFVVEGDLEQVSDAGILIHGKQARGRKELVTTVAWPDVLGAHLVAVP
ncbi:MAG: ribosome maturation factor RimP [Candidatus Dormiibacterota bacterium]